MKPMKNKIINLIGINVVLILALIMGFLILCRSFSWSYINGSYIEYPIAIIGSGIILATIFVAYKTSLKYYVNN